MTLFVDTIAKEVPDLHKNNIKLRFIGNLGLLPPHARAALEDATTQTAQNTGLTLIVALSYSSRWELVEAAKNIASQVKAGSLSMDHITEATLSEALTTSDFPDPELMIRTSGEFRISNFLLYQLAYAELYFTETRWPDFRKDDLIKAILDFQSRERRFGKTSNQLLPNDEK
jgi:undecaprenyl diphosphate synthase